MNIFRAAAAGFACFLMPPGGAAGQTPETSAAAAVAVQQAVIGEPGQRMTLAIWHPAAPAASGPEAGGAAGANGHRLPLVVVSHGTGAGPMAHVDTARALAAAGFVVVAPMHRGDNFQDDSGVGRPGWMASRSRDVSNAIDFMLQIWAGREQVDASRIGIFGFSAGATTALISVGGVPDLGRVVPHCAARPEFVCNLIATQTGAAGAPPPRWTHDRRIAAAVLAAPGLGFAFEPSGLDSVTVPVQLWAGSADRTVPYDTNAGLVQRLLRGRAELHNVDNAVHLSFLAPCGPEGPPQLCEDNPGFDRLAFHTAFNRSVVAFFQAHLGAGGKGRK